MISDDKFEITAAGCYPPDGFLICGAVSVIAKVSALPPIVIEEQQPCGCWTHKCGPISSYWDGIELIAPKQTRVRVRVLQCLEPFTIEVNCE